MGRKKKAKAPAPVIVNTQKIEYQGSVNLSITHGDKTIMKKKYHNSGMPNLFKFLAYCLAGLKSESLRPVKIKLFKYNGDKLPNEFDWEESWNASSKPVSVSPYIVFDTTPIVKPVKNQNSKIEAYTTTLHFRIPFSYIVDANIYLIGLYSNNISDDADVTAFYKLTTTDGSQWDPITVPDVANGNYSIIIEWELSISNKVTTTN